MGGLAANWLSDNIVEIRHLAVRSEYQGRSVGRRLVENLIKMTEQDSPVRVETYARNTSVGFFAELGFILTNEYLEHPDFTKHGITTPFFEKYFPLKETYACHLDPELT